VVVTEPETVLRDNVAGEGIESTAKYKNVAVVLGLGDTLGHEFYLVPDNRLKFGDAPLREHGIKGCSADSMKVAFGSRESHGISAEPPRHPLILIVSSF
jgi:hypothetical protein